MVSGGIDRPQYTVRYSPLGSPWDGPKQLSLGTNMVAGPCVSRWVRGGVYGWGIPGGVLGGWYTGYYPATRLQRLHWYCQGPTDDRSGRYRVPGHSRVPPGPFRTPGSRTHGYALLDPIRRDSALNILKLVHNLECHLNMLMRPGIVPDSKRGSETTTLNF